MDTVTAMDGALSLPVTIRRARREDLPELEWFGLHTPHREIIATAYRAQERGLGALLVADVNGFPAGQLCVDFQRKRSLRHGTLWALRVFQPFRKLGLGTRLILAGEAAVLEHGYTKVELGVDRDNAGVLGFYDRLGYEPCGTERGRYSYRTPDGNVVQVAIDQWILSKILRREAAWRRSMASSWAATPPPSR